MRGSIILCALALTACGSDESPSGTNTSPTEITDAQLSALTRVTSGFQFYKFRLDTLQRSTASGHSEARLRTRYNGKAAEQLDASGKVRAGANFADSSLIVKELIVGGTLSRYAVMFKLRGSSNAGNGGWLWAYYAPDGSPQIGIAGRGQACQACHSAGLDFTRMNDSHP